MPNLLDDVDEIRPDDAKDDMAADDMAAAILDHAQLVKEEEASEQQTPKRRRGRPPKKQPEQEENVKGKETKRLEENLQLLHNQIEILQNEIREIYNKHESFKTEVAEFIQALPEIVRQSVQQIATVNKPEPESEIKEQNVGVTEQPKDNPSPPVNIPDQLAVEAALKQADLEFIEKLQSLQGIDKLIFLSRNLSGAIGLLESLKGNSGQQQAGNPLAGFEAALGVFSQMFSYMTKIFEMASEAVGRAQQVAIKSSRIAYQEPVKESSKKE